MNIHELRHDPNGRYAVVDQGTDGADGSISCHSGTFVTDYHGLLSAAHRYLEERGHPVSAPLSSRLVGALTREEGHVIEHEHLLVYYGSRKLFVYRESDVYPMDESGDAARPISADMSSAAEEAEPC